MKTIITTAATMAIAATTHAATLATPDYDTDAYVFFGTNNQFNPQITIGESTPSGHFNWSHISFDASSLTASGEKYLTLSATEYVTNTPNPGGPPTTTTSTTGSATIQLVALGAAYNDYLAAPDRLAWYNENVQNAGVPILGTYNFNDQQTLSVKVTDTVNNWISSTSSNNGFALFSTAGNVELGSMTFNDPASRPALTDTAAIPEPSTAILASLSLLTLTLRRHR